MILTRASWRPAIRHAGAFEFARVEAHAGTDQIREAGDTHLSHNSAAMYLDRDDADPKSISNLLVSPAVRQHCHYLMLAWCQ